MLSQYVRVIHSDNGSLTDNSLISQDRTNAFTLPIVSGEDYLYIGQYYPTNNLYFSLDTANSNSASISIDVWNNEWVSAVDILDGTSSSGASMAQSGVVQWDIDRDDMGWQQLHDPTNEGSDLGFNSLKIYDLYWLRISFSANLSAGSDVTQVTYRFANDNDLKAKAPDINDYLSSWESGKTSWNEQLIEASLQLVYKLKGDGIIAHPGNILRFDEINIPCAYKALSIIYEGISGEDYEVLSIKMANKANNMLKNMPIVVDRDLNAAVDTNDELNKVSVGKLVR
jgi:hypothetical protein